MHLPRVWLITGASSGFGKALTEVLLRKGDIVVTTLRKPSVLEPLTKQFPPSQLLLLPLDVTRPSEISVVLTRTQEIFGRLDVVFNNAGYGILGEVEAVSDADARALFEVNFWGVVSNSSMMVFSGEPGLSFYCASKRAVDGFSESFSMELQPEWNIKICILQTGAFDTNVFAVVQYFPSLPAYTDSAAKHLLGVYRRMSLDGDPHKFAEMLYRLVISANEGKKIPLFLPIGMDALGRLQDRLRKMKEVLEDGADWSVDLKKNDDGLKVTAKL